MDKQKKVPKTLRSKWKDHNLIRSTVNENDHDAIRCKFCSGSRPAGIENPAGIKNNDFFDSLQNHMVFHPGRENFTSDMPSSAPLNCFTPPEHACSMRRWTGIEKHQKYLSFRLDWKYLPSSTSDMWIFIKKLEKTLFQYSISIFCHEIAYALGLSTWLS